MLNISLLARRAAALAALAGLAAQGCKEQTAPAIPAPVADVVVAPETFSLPVGGTLQLTATMHDGSGHPLSGRTVVWTTSNLAVATVSSTGLVTAISAAPATITATSEGKSGTALLVVLASSAFESAIHNPATFVSVCPTADSIYANVITNNSKNICRSQ